MSNKAVGIDGCKFGWIAACYEDRTINIFKAIAEVWDHFGNDCDFLIDMPIGLPSVNIPQRTCEQMARMVLPKGKKSSLFPVPCREAFAAETYPQANEINRRVLGKGITKQTWFIMPKIYELDQLLIRNDQAKLKFKESHPEIAFQFLNAGKPLAANKKTDEGIRERLRILKKHQPEIEQLYRRAYQEFRRVDVAADDIIDALCLSIMQVKIQDNSASGIRYTFPEKPVMDESGIEMAIYYAP